jgi:hypothetical protein
MDLVLPGAVSLARALLTLSRSEQSGVLHVSSSVERFKLVLDAGVVRALSGGDSDQHALGDVLLASGALNCVRYSEALAREVPSAPIGAWLIRTGSTTPAALQCALRHQMRDRVKRILLSTSLEYHFGRQAVDADDSWLETPFGASDLVLFGLRALFAERDFEKEFVSWPGGNLCLSGLGQSLVRGATLWPEELAVVELLRHGAPLNRIREVLATRVRGLRFLLALHVLGAITVSQARDSQYGSLLHKLRQARQAVGASALLELPSFATEAQARRALHKLAGQFHPDTLGPHAPTELRAASHEVMAALNAAEQHLRRSGLRR